MPIRQFILSCLCSFFAINAFCSTIPTDITKTVVFIYKNADAEPNHADGTGFLIGIPVPSKPENSWAYLVTAQHIVRTNPNDLNSPMLDRIFVRLNKRSGDSITVPVELRPSGPNQTVFLESDASIDIAVIPFGIRSTEYDLLLLPENMLVTQDDFKSYNIGVGCDMFFTGMFAPYQGKKRNQPIVRFGKLAMIPDEKITFGGTQIDAYLVETFSFGGNSGSPVFFYPSADNTPGRLNLGQQPIKIAGVMKGFFGDIEPIMLVQPTDLVPQVVPVSQSNSGIAVVIPAAHIREILHSDALERQRR